MIHSFSLSNHSTSVSLQQQPYFSVLHFTAAVQTKGTPKNAAALYINVMVRNESDVFNMRMNWIPGTNQFHCFDVLATARQIPSLHQTRFQEIVISVEKETYQDAFLITLSLEAS